MKKIIITLSTCVLLNSGYAGTVGDVHTVSQSITPFGSAEGSATWIATDSSNFYGQKPALSLQHWGGRLAVGALFPHNEHIKFSSEMGWGSYGTVKSINNVTAPSIYKRMDCDIYGFDLLVGALYSYQQFDAFFKVGAMAENRNYTGVLISGPTTLTQKNLQTNVNPEIKVGGIYNVNDQLGVTLAYMRVFGNNNTEASFTSNVSSSSLKNPTLDSVMFGLTYKLA